MTTPPGNYRQVPNLNMPRNNKYRLTGSSQSLHSLFITSADPDLRRQPFISVLLTRKYIPATHSFLRSRPRSTPQICTHTPNPPSRFCHSRWLPNYRPPLRLGCRYRDHISSSGHSHVLELDFFAIERI